MQPPNSWMAPKSIGEGASSLFGGWPGSPENVSCSTANPDSHRCNLGVALEQEIFWGFLGHPPKRLTCFFWDSLFATFGLKGPNDPCSGQKLSQCSFSYRFRSGAEKAHKHKETHRTSPISGPTLKFFMWGSLPLENKGEGATHIKN